MAEDSIARNLDAISRRLAKIEDQFDEDGRLRTEALEAPPFMSGETGVGCPGYDQLTAENDARRETEGWGAPDLDACLTDEDHERFRAWRDTQRLSWSRGDLVTVGLAALVGSLAVVFDDWVDGQVSRGLAYLKDTTLVQSWEVAARNMPIDYTGPGFGGPAHRVRSAGHDMGRPFAALDQIRRGAFTGTVWEAGQRIDFTTGPGSYLPVSGVSEPLVLWGKHLVADVLTPMSLPLPGWTHLYDLPSREIRKFAHDAYSGPTLGSGINARTGLLNPLLVVLTTETIVRLHLHWGAWSQRGRLGLSAAEKQKRSEMLLSSYALVGAASIGNAIARGFLGEGPLALRHISVPVLMRAGMLAVSVMRDTRRRARLAPPSWDELLEELTYPWDIDAAAELERAGWPDSE